MFSSVVGVPQIKAFLNPTNQVSFNKGLHRENVTFLILTHFYCSIARFDGGASFEFVCLPPIIMGILWGVYTIHQH